MLGDALRAAAALLSAAEREEASRCAARLRCLLGSAGDAATLHLVHAVCAALCSGGNGDSARGDDTAQRALATDAYYKSEFKGFYLINYLGSRAPK